MALALPANRLILSRFRSPDPAFGLADPLAGTQLATRDTSVAWMTFMGIPQEGMGIDSYERLADYASAPADSAWVFACVNRIANAASSVPLRVYVKAGRDLVPWEDEPSNAAQDLQTLLDTVNPVDMAGSELRAYTAASRKVWGGWYWKRARGRLLHDTQELYWLRVPDVKPISTDGRRVDYYEYRPSAPAQAGMEAIEPANMIRHRGLNLVSQIEMMSPLSAARYDMVTDEAAAMHTASMLRRRGVPEGYWKAAKDAIITPQDKSAIRRWLRQLVGPRNAGRSLVAPDIEYQALSLPEKDAEWLDARKTSRMMVSAILGVPLVLAGDDEHAGVYRSVRDAQGVFWKDTMIPELDADADTVNNWLTPEFNRSGDPVLVVAYDFSGVEAIRPLWNEEWSGWLNAIDRQAVTPNQFRKHFKLTGGDVPWGDRPVPRTTITLRPQDVPDLSSALPVLEGEDAPASPDANASDEAGDDEAMRSVRRLYAQDPVRAFLAGEPLDVTVLLGRQVTPEAQRVIEDGLHRRESSVQIADRLGAIRKKADSSDVLAAVQSALARQWPPEQLEIVREGTWTFDPKFPMKKINAARRPIARNPKVVAGIEAALKVGAAITPITIIHTKVAGEPGYKPIDGWHHVLAAEHEGMDTIPAYVGEGDAAWVEQLLAFNDTIPTPSAVKMADVLALADKFATALLNQPAPQITVSAPPPVIVPAPIVKVQRAVRMRKVVIRDETGQIIETRDEEI